MSRETLIKDEKKNRCCLAISLTFAIILTIFISFKIDIVNSNLSSIIYVSGILIIIFTATAYYHLIKSSVNLYKIKRTYKNPEYENTYLNNPVYMFLSIFILTLLLGYYYIILSNENNLKDFLLILSAAFINSLAAASALKYLIKVKEKE